MKKHKQPDKPTNKDKDENTPSTDPKSKRKSRDTKDKSVIDTGDAAKVRHDDADEMVYIDATEKKEIRNEKREDDDDDDVAVGKKKKKVKKSKASGSLAVQLLTPEPEVGLGGPSAWDL